MKLPNILICCRNTLILFNCKDFIHLWQDFRCENQHLKDKWWNICHFGLGTIWCGKWCVENLWNGPDAEFECIIKDAEDFIMNAESSATQENALEAVIHPETMAQNESDCDFVINTRNSCSHTVRRQQIHNESSNSLEPIKEPKVCSGEKYILIRKLVRGKQKKSQVARKKIRFRWKGRWGIFWNFILYGIG